MKTKTGGCNRIFLFSFFYCCKNVHFNMGFTFCVFKNQMVIMVEEDDWYQKTAARNGCCCSLHL